MTAAPTTRVRLALLAGMLLLAGCQAAANCIPTELMPDKESKKDAQARIDYYKNAAKQYYEGGSYQQSVAMWDKYLAEFPDDQWAKFGLAKALQMIGTVPTLRRAEAVLKPIMDLQWQHPTRGDIKFEVQSTLAITYSQLADFYDRDIREIDEKLRKDVNADTQSLQEWHDRQVQMRNNLLHQSIPLYSRLLPKPPWWCPSAYQKRTH